jgi:RNA 2',3'-cyclic 3'-phosphodiesterase
MKSTEQWRIFCAIDLPDTIRSKIGKHINQLRQDVPQAQASWVRPDNIHLTLKFIGETPKARATEFSDAISRAAKYSEGFATRVGQAGAFPKNGPPRVLWIGVNDFSGKLVALQSRLEDEAAREGFPKEERPFHPHLTIARLRKPHGARTLAEAHRQLGFDEIEFDVHELLVIRSELGGDGSKYTVVSRHSLSRQTVAN